MTFSNTLTHSTPLLSDYWYSPWKCMPFALACRVRFLNQLSVQSGGLDIILHKTASTSDWGVGGGGGRRQRSNCKSKWGMGFVTVQCTVHGCFPESQSMLHSSTKTCLCNSRTIAAVKDTVGRKTVPCVAQYMSAPPLACIHNTAHGKTFTST